MGIHAHVEHDRLRAGRPIGETKSLAMWSATAAIWLSLRGWDGRFYLSGNVT